MSLIVGAISTTTTVRTRFTVTGGELEVFVREALVAQGIIDANQPIDFDWDVSQSLVRELVITWDTQA